FSSLTGIGREYKRYKITQLHKITEQHINYTQK
ncbi:unnamed protein product, partial [marine sediment metagenome]